MSYTSYRHEVDKFLDIKKDKALTAVGLYVRGQARLLCSGFKRPTGNLAGKINYKVGKNEVQIGTNVEYALYVEKGTGIYAQGGKGRKTPWVFKSSDGNFYVTRGQRAQPFLTPAAEMNIGVIRRIIKEVMSE